MKYVDQEFRFEGPDGVSYNSPFEYVTITLLGMCGCNDDEILNDIHTVLTQLNAPDLTYYHNFNVVGPDKYKELLLSVLDKADLIEHGSSIRGSWLTGKGKEVVEKYMQRTEQE